MPTVDEPPILALAGVTIESAPGYDSAIWNVSLSLRQGELALVKLAGAARVPLADAALGLVEPAGGTARFLGRDWQVQSAWEAATMRGRVGRVFDASGGSGGGGHGWVSNLDVDENVLLAQRHHGRRPRGELTAEAAKLAQAFGLLGLPRGRPADVRAADLQRAACVRAFVGTPDLLILERPSHYVYPEIMRPLLGAVRAARARGAAVLWTTDQPEIWNEPAIRPTFKCVMSGTQMLVSDG